MTMSVVKEPCGSGITDRYAPLFRIWKLLPSGSVHQI